MVKKLREKKESEKLRIHVSMLHNEREREVRDGERESGRERGSMREHARERWSQTVSEPEK